MPPESSPEAMSNEELRDRLSALPCPFCGEQDYAWGDLETLGGARFMEEGTPFLVAFKKRLLRGGLVPARRCKTCGNIQMFGGT